MDEPRSELSEENNHREYSTEEIEEKLCQDKNTKKKFKLNEEKNEEKVGNSKQETQENKDKCIEREDLANSSNLSKLQCKADHELEKNLESQKVEFDHTKEENKEKVEISKNLSDSPSSNLSSNQDDTEKISRNLSNEINSTLIDSVSNETKEQPVSSILGDIAPKTLTFLKVESKNKLLPKEEPKEEKESKNIFSMNGPKKKKENSDFLQIQSTANEKKPETSSSSFSSYGEWKANGRLFYNEEGEWINMGEGEIIIKDNRIIFIRSGLKTILLNVPVESTDFEKEDKKIKFTANGRRSTGDSYEIVSREYQIEFSKNDSLVGFLLKIKH
jgi:hypothetical protein